jgi:hypothetical protein
MAQMLAAMALTVALIGFSVRRSQRWLIGSALALAVLLVAATIVIEASA